MKTKLRRAGWLLCQALFIRVGIRWKGDAWRCMVLRWWGAEIGPGCRIPPSVKVLQPWRLKLGANCLIGNNVDLYNFDWITIGEQTVVSQNTYVCTGSHDYTDPTFPLVFQPITIGSECWVAADVFVAPGVTIGDGTVVAARSVVVKDLPAWMVCAGHPCKPLKERVIRDDSTAS